MKCEAKNGKMKHGAKNGKMKCEVKILENEMRSKGMSGKKMRNDM